jgi:hypothetical protein
MIKRLALIVSAAMLLPTAADAATYSAKPIVPVAAKRIVGRDISWSCGPAACLGSTDDSRPLVLCQGLAKQAGRIQSFVVNGVAIGATELDKCNSVARGGPAPILARN